MELLDIYNKNRERTGRTIIRGNPVKDGDYILVVHVWIINDNDEFLIQKRHPSKKIYPDMWDCAVAGAATTGDNSAKAAVREAKEELNINLDIEKGRVLFTDEFSFGFDDIWLVRQNINLETISLQKDEVVEVKWVSKDEIEQMVDNGEFIQYYYINKFFSMIDWRKL